MGVRPAIVRDGLLIVAAVLAAAVVAALGAGGYPFAVRLGGYFCAAVALLGGMAFAVTPPPPRQSARFRVLLGLAVAIGSLNVTFAATGGPLSTAYHPWDGLTAATAIGCVVGAVVNRSHSMQLLSSLRVAVESVLVGIGLTAVCWFYLFAPIGLAVQDAISVVLLAGIGGFLMSLSMITFTRGREVGLAVASICAAGLVFAALLSNYNFVTVGDPGWHGQAVSCLLWPGVIMGIFHTADSPGGLSIADQAHSEWRVLMLVSTVVVCLLSLFGAGVLAAAGLGPITAGIAFVFVVTLWGRELMRAWQSHAMIVRLAEQARVDSLTELPNARSLDERLEELGLTYDGRLSCLTIDLDRFKDVNDLLGRAVGDELLRVFGTELVALAGRFGAEVFRSGGDEFVVLSLGSDEVAEVIAHQIGRIATAATDDIPGLARVPVRASVGVAHVDVESPGDLLPAEARASLVQSAQAMRQAKAKRAGVALFDQPLASTQRRSRQIEELLRGRLSDGRGVDVHFQPVMALSTGEMVGVEALARWADEALGNVATADFIAIAEDSGLMEELGEHILRTALRGAVATGMIERGLWVAVNVSALQLRARGFTDLVAQALGHAGVPPRQLVIEVTESVFVRPDDPAVVTLTELASLGLRVSLDDFGTGYSSLAYLTRLPVGGLKIDRSITRALQEPKSAAIAVSITEMARQLGLEIVVEGIETIEEERQVRALGLEYGQGLLYAPALSVSDLAALIRRHQQRDRAGVESPAGDGPEATPERGLAPRTTDGAVIGVRPEHGPGSIAKPGV